MSFSFSNFDTNGDTEFSNSFPVLPAGKYRVQAVKATRKQNYEKTGDCLEIQWEVTRGEHEGKRITRWLDLWVSDMEKQRKAEAEMRAICVAMGLTGDRKPRSEQAILNIQVVAHVSQYKKKNKPGEFGNGIDKYESVESAIASQRQTVPAREPGIDDDVPF